MSKHSKFSRTSIVIALSAVFPAAGAYADEDMAALINPNEIEVAVKIPYVDKINPLYRQYNGINNKGVNGNLDVNIVNRSEDGSWFKLKAENVGLSTVEVGTSYGKQGDWSLGLEYNQIPRYSPYDVITNVTGIGSNTIQQPNLANGQFSGGRLITPPSNQVTLKTERDITTLLASKYLLEGLKLSFSFKNEEKTGLRMSGVAGVAGTGTPNLYSGFLFAPEPINQTHQQFEGTLDYVTKQFQLQAGYYGSFLNTKYDSLTVLPGTNTALVVQGAANNLSPISLAPDNSFQQLFVSGAYNFSKDTRANFKAAYSEGRQTDAFFGGFAAGNLPLAGAGASLNGRVQTTELSAAVTSRITKDLKVLGSWRFEDKDDKTPVRAFYTNGTTNNPDSHIANKGKFEIDYNIGAGYGVTGGLEYSDKRSSQFEIVSAGSSWARAKMSEVTTRVVLRKSLSDTVNGNITLSHADRTGSDLARLSGVAAMPLLTPVYLADRTRDKVRAMIDWAPAEKLNLQIAYEGYFDDYKQSIYGLDKGKGQMLSLDGNYAINDSWNLNAWYSKQTGDAKQYMRGTYCNGVTLNCAVTVTTDWSANLKSNSDQFGLGAKGKLSSFDIGAQYLYSIDGNKQQLSAANNFAGAAGGWGLMPDTKYTLQTLKLFGTYTVSKATKLRLDYIYDHRKMDDYTWTNWVYADGTRVNVNPNQTTQLIGLTLIQSF